MSWLSLETNTTHTTDCYIRHPQTDREERNSEKETRRANKSRDDFRFQRKTSEKGKKERKTDSLTTL